MSRRSTWVIRFSCPATPPVNKRGPGFGCCGRIITSLIRFTRCCWAEVNRGRSNGDRRWGPSFQPVRIELPVAKRESQDCGLVFEVSDVAFGPLHRITQHIAGQRLDLRVYRASRISLSWERSELLSGENEPSNAAEPMVKASQPAALNSAICSLVLTLPALTR